jgi:hypothetical protein
MFKYKGTLICIVTILMAMPACSKVSAPGEGIFVDFSSAEKVRKQINDEKYLPAYKKLLSNAEKAMNEGLFSVMQKKRIPASGDKHDYISMGPYWWPDTTKPDGLPYIRRDGNVNPETRGDYVDTDKKSAMMANVESLTWAYYFSGEQKYATKAVELIKTWFTDPETRMNPNLNYSQGIPGICDGRGIGIIDFSRIEKVITPLQILEANDKLDESTLKSLHSWFEEYLNWLMTSANGIDEEDEKNNHATWYDVQVCGIALYVGKLDIAKKRLEDVKAKRINTQIDPDGSQPFELARTRSLSYSSMNLRGFLDLAVIGRSVDVDLWNYTSPDGRSIKKAVDYLLPYSGGATKWNGEQITSMDEALDGLQPDFQIAYYLSKDKKYDLENRAENLERLLFPGI